MSVYKSTAGPVHATEPNFRLFLSIRCQTSYIYRHFTLSEAFLHYICQFVVCTQERVYPNCYQFCSKFGQPIAVSITLAKSESYAGSFSSLSEHFINDSIIQGYPKLSLFHISLSNFKLMDQLYCRCTGKCC